MCEFPQTPPPLHEHRIHFHFLRFTGGSQAPPHSTILFPETNSLREISRISPSSDELSWDPDGELGASDEAAHDRTDSSTSAAVSSAFLVKNVESHCEASQTVEYTRK